VEKYRNPRATEGESIKTDRRDITEILLKVALNTIKQTNKKYIKLNLIIIE
jgi:hypothetical protein